jgi:hypothetical protein
MSQTSVDPEWLVRHGLRMGTIIVTGLLLAHLLNRFVWAFGIEHLYGVRATLVSVIRYTTLGTAVLYAVRVGSESPSETPGSNRYWPVCRSAARFSTEGSNA